MSYARNLARLSRAGVPAVNSLQDIRDLTIYDNLYPPGVIARGHTTPDDGGGGYFNIITGQTPAHFVDDGGITVVFTGGDGSAAALRQIDHYITTAMFGAVRDGVTDCSDVFDRISAYVLSRSHQIDPEWSAPSYAWKMVMAPPTIVISPGVHAISRTWFIQTSVDIEFAAGSLLVALTQGMRMMYASYDNTLGLFGLRDITIRNLRIDGAEIANAGLILDTCSIGTRIVNPSINRVTGYNFTGVTATTGQGSSAREVLFSDASNVRPLDLVSFPDSDNPHFTYVVISVSGSMVTLDTFPSGDFVGGQVIHRAVGLQGCMLQEQTIEAGSIRYCDLGLFLGKNLLEFASTDTRIYGMFMHGNKCGIEVSSSVGTRFTDCSSQYSTNYPDLILRGCDATTLDGFWVENLHTEHYIAGVDYTAIPHIRVSGGYNNHFRNIAWVNNPNSSEWRRLMVNNGKNTFVQGFSTNREGFLENPDRPGEYAPFEQQDFYGSLKVEYEGSQSQIQYPYDLIVDENGGETNQGHAEIISAGAPIYKSGQEMFTSTEPTGTTEILSFYLKGDLVPRVEIRGKGVAIGDGQYNASKVLGSPDWGWTKPTGTTNRQAWDTATVDLETLAQSVKTILNALLDHGLLKEGAAPE